MAEAYGKQLKNFRTDCLKLASVNKSDKQTIKMLLSNEHINNYVQTDIEWFNNSFEKHKTLKTPSKTSRTISKELKKIQFNKKEIFWLYGEPVQLEIIELTDKNASKTIKTIQTLAQKMNIDVPTKIYLCDDDNCYMYDEDTLLLGNENLDHYADYEIEIILAHELGHKKTGTILKDFNTLQNIATKLNTKYPDDLLYFFITAIERWCDKIAIKTTNNPSAFIRVHQDDDFRSPEPRTDYYFLADHPMTQERIEFGYQQLQQQTYSAKLKSNLEMLKNSLSKLKQKLTILSGKLNF